MRRIRFVAVALMLATSASAEPVEYEPTRAAHQIGDLPLNIQGAATLLGIVAVIFTILVGFRKMRRENEADARERAEEIKEAHRADATRIEQAQRERSDELRDQLKALQVSLGERLVKVETIVTDFVPRREIDARFEHDKNGSLTRDKALETRVDRHAEDIRMILVDVGSLKQRQDGFGHSLARIEELIRENTRETSAKIDRLQETFEQRPRR